ncbi:hypothetical protein [Paenibacillus sp. MMS20-IR301]|uniref:hypothetical protein n=1 Tax=Paenibacillus sp. MMS20-IR301 TaxID=2895946 RepID=UPI0028E809B7|nr:hypothetical protein [Paenibacillus sp. MMS20-IR301]WNS40998.1 hypothetical protein LOS79_18295 [Paenibacillus sp. MMS20-IR301]
MENISAADQLESIQSMQSTIKKLESALSQMTQSGTNTTLVQKRLNAMNIGLAVLEGIWKHTPQQYTREDAAEARKVISGLLPSVEHSFAKAKEGGPQKTLLARRITALKLVIQAIDSL